MNKPVSKMTPVEEAQNDPLGSWDICTLLSTNQITWREGEAGKEAWREGFHPFRGLADPVEAPEA